MTMTIHTASFPQNDYNLCGTERLEARAVARLRDLASDQIAGLLYEWNTGETQIAWFGKASTCYSAEPLE